jgi:3-deoxy-7-phosphoheptulonate synthase
MLKFLLFCLCLQFTSGWTPASWRTLQKMDKQMPIYHSKEILENVETTLAKQAPLVSADECHLLKKEIERAGRGKAFLFMGGDCAESPRKFFKKQLFKEI